MSVSGQIQQYTMPQIRAMWETAFMGQGSEIPYLRPYKHQLQAIFPSERTIYIPYSAISYANHNLATLIIEHPEKVLKVGSMELYSQFPDDVRATTNGDPYQMPIIRITGIDDISSISIKDIRSNHIAQLFSITGRIRKSQVVRSVVWKAVWKCDRCKVEHTILNKGTTLEEPLVCNQDEGGCGSTRNRTKFILVEDKTIYRNLQIIYLEEQVNISEGQPQSKMVWLWDDIVGIYPCNHATVTGIIKTIHIKKRDDAIMDTYIEAVSIDVEDIQEPVTVSPAEAEQIMAIAHGPNPFDELKRSVAPSVFSENNILDDVKEAIILQQVNGMERTLADGTRKRSKIHILLVGDPSVAKSHLMKTVPSISPIAVYGSGEGTTGAGLTFTMEHDEFDGTWSVRMGLFPMCDSGICVFDEMDKIDKEDRKRMHTALEDGELPVAKAGIVTTLKSNAALLAGANPTHGKFDINKILYDQIELDPPLMSRFDLIFAIADYVDRAKDERIAEHILSAFEDEGEENMAPLYAPEFLRKYFYYVRENYNPSIPLEIRKHIKEQYVNLRQMIPGLLTRHLEGILRLSVASAKIRASNEVEVQDVERAMRLFQSFLRSVSMDHSSGNIDLAIITTGMSTDQHTRVNTLITIIRDLNNGKAVHINELMLEAEHQGLKRTQVEKDIETMIRNGHIFESGADWYKVA